MSETTNVMNSEVVKRLLCYVSYDTQSKDESSEVPSTQKQFDLAKVLKKELEEIGASDVRLSDHCYVYAKIPSNLDKKVPAIGFIAHMDTSPALSGKDIKPQIIQNYDGGVIKLGESGFSMGPNEFPALAELKGKSLITTDGTTLLGADDKAGVSEIMTVVEQLLGSDTPHGKICIGFTPDEEVGSGADLFDVEGFGADYAYTVDGGIETEIVYENFNASGAKFEINGVNIHPGDAKDKMVNASIVAMEINSMLPKLESPEHTEMYEGFYHLTGMSGNVEHAELSYIVRDHDSACFEAKEKTLRHIEKVLNEKYGAGTVKLEIHEQYRNMAEKIKPCMHLIDHAKDVMKELGLTPDVSPVRGGTDGARLSFMGLPCPNLGTGGYAFHGPYEHITAEGMDLSVKIILGIIGKYAKETK